MSLTPGFPAHGYFMATYCVVMRYLTYPALRAQYQKGKLLCELFVTLKDTLW
jgi:hypothetical protein